VTHHRGLPWHALVALTLAVLALHWMAWRAAAPVFAPGRAATAANFQVRTIEARNEREGAPAGVASGHGPAAHSPRPAAAAPLPARESKPSVVRMRSGGPAPAPAFATAKDVPVELRASIQPAAAPMPAASMPGAPTLAVAVPGSATFRYHARSRVRGVEVEGEAVLRWQQDGSRYDALLEWTLPGRPTRTQRSTGAITVRGLAPQRYSDRTRSEEATHFDHEAGRIVFSANRPAAVLHPGTQDRLSVLLQLSAWAAGDATAFAPGRSVLVHTAGARESMGWRFDIDALERLELPGGTVEALRLTRPALHEHDALLELWLGPGPAYAPVRLRLTPPGGDWLDLQWSGTDRG
jgi:hypothetical protein